MDEISNDDRFRHIGKDPRFRRIPKNEKKVKIDSRFQSMFTDKKFKLKYTVDKRGRPVNKTTSENLKKFYDIDEEEKSDAKSESEQDEQCEDATTGNDETGSAPNAMDSDDSGDEEKESEQPGHEIPYISEDGPDFARGGGNLESSSEDEEESGKEEEEVETLVDDSNLDPDWVDLDKDAPETENITCRLAICNMNWDRIKSKDIFVLLSSFLPPGGVIHSVVIYPSEFGLQRMAEEVLGPAELKSDKEPSTGDREANQKQDEKSIRIKVDPEKIRKYQLSRLKYYYAVVECDSKETANKLYEECDGQEYESSSARLDLRFVPDDLTFEQEPKDECRSMPDVSVYKPSMFTTTALCQAKVDLTWDETDHERLKLTMRKWADDFENEDFSKVLASDSSSGDEKSENENSSEDGSDKSKKKQEQKLQKYKNILQALDQEEGGEKKGVDEEMEITWEPDLKMVTKDILKKREKAAKEKTPWEEYKQRKKEKKKQKREEKKTEKMKQKGIVMEQATSAVGDDELAGDAGFDDPFFNDDPQEDNKQSKRKNKQKKKDKQENLTQEYLELQEKEQAKLKLLMMDEDDHRNHFSLEDLLEKEDSGKKKKMKKKKKKEAQEKSEAADDKDTFTMDLNDERFVDIYKSHLFNIDPSAPEFKNTKGTKSLIEEKLRKRKRGELVVESTVPESAKRKTLDENGEANNEESVESFLKQKQSVSSLIRSVKAKTDLVHQKRKMKRTR